MTVVVLSHSFSECPLCYTIRVDILIMNAWKVITPITMINFKRLKNQRMLSLHGLDDYSQDKVTFTARTCSKNGSILNLTRSDWQTISMFKYNSFCDWYGKHLPFGYPPAIFICCPKLICPFWKINLEKSSLTNCTFSLFQTKFVLPV